MKDTKSISVYANIHVVWYLEKKIIITRQGKITSNVLLSLLKECLSLKFNLHIFKGKGVKQQRKIVRE
jgi:hypothetical protein